MTRIRRLYDTDQELILQGSGGYNLQPNYSASPDFLFCWTGWNW